MTNTRYCTLNKNILAGHFVYLALDNHISKINNYRAYYFKRLSVFSFVVFVNSKLFEESKYNTLGEPVFI